MLVDCCVNTIVVEFFGMLVDSMHFIDMIVVAQMYVHKGCLMC